MMRLIVLKLFGVP